jgi:hypothetical protein
MNRECPECKSQRPAKEFNPKVGIVRDVCYHCHDRMRRLAYRSARPEIRWAAKYRSRMRALGLEPVVETFTRSDVVNTYGSSCFHCGTGEFEQLDHFPTPVAHGGTHTLRNVRPSCGPCNRAGSRVRRNHP